MSQEATTDHEEKEQCVKMHEIISEYKLDGEFRYAELHAVYQLILSSTVGL